MPELQLIEVQQRADRQCAERAAGLADLYDALLGEAVGRQPAEHRQAEARDGAEERGRAQRRVGPRELEDDHVAHQHLHVHRAPRAELCEQEPAERRHAEGVKGADTALLLRRLAAIVGGHRCSGARRCRHFLNSDGGCVRGGCRRRDLEVGAAVRVAVDAAREVVSLRRVRSAIAIRRCAAGRGVAVDLRGEVVALGRRFRRAAAAVAVPVGRCAVVVRGRFGSLARLVALAVAVDSRGEVVFASPYVVGIGRACRRVGGGHLYPQIRDRFSRGVPGSRADRDVHGKVILATHAPQEPVTQSSVT